MNARHTLWPATLRNAFLAAAFLLFCPARSQSQPALGAWIDPGHGDGCAPVESSPFLVGNRHGSIV